MCKLCTFQLFYSVKAIINAPSVKEYLVEEVMKVDTSAIVLDH